MTVGRKRTNYYPIMLDVGGRRCLVIGGGPVAERKTMGLLEAGADVTIVSPRLTARLAELVEDGAVRAARREYRTEDLQGAALVFAAASSRETNERVAKDATAAGIWANIADRAEDGDFITPSVVRRGELVLTASASGASPALASRIADELSDVYGESYAAYADWLRRLRETAMLVVADAAERRRVLRAALDVAEREWRGDADEAAIRTRVEGLQRLTSAAAGRDGHEQMDDTGMSGKSGG